jgi:hypothetical protein
MSDKPAVPQAECKYSPSGKHVRPRGEVCQYCEEDAKPSSSPERCPTCGSGDKSVVRRYSSRLGWHFCEHEDHAPCRDPWHTAQSVPQQPECHTSDYRLGGSDESEQSKKARNQESSSTADGTADVQALRTEGRREGLSAGQLDSNQEVPILQARRGSAVPAPVEAHTASYDSFMEGYAPYHGSDCQECVKVAAEKNGRQPTISLAVYQHDWIPGFAAFHSDGSIKEGSQAHVVLNLGSLLCAVACGDLPRQDLPYMIAETLMHETIHALEDWAGVEFSEERVEKLLNEYHAKYGEGKSHWVHDSQTGYNPVQDIREAALQDKQKSMVDWGTKCFGAEQMTDPKVRGLRLLEEAIEFAQAVGVPFDQGRALFNYVYSHPAGNPTQELGGVGVTWLAAAGSLGTSAEECLDTEIARVLSKTPEHFAARNKVKVDAGFGAESLLAEKENKE